MPATNSDPGPAAHDGQTSGQIAQLDDGLGYHLRLAHGASQRNFSATFGALGLTRTQVAVLWLLCDHPGMSQVDIGQRLQMDRATTMGIINRLQARHLLRRERSASDGRKQALHLEPQGDALLDAVGLALAAHESWVKSHFTEAESRTLIELLARLHG